MAKHKRLRIRDALPVIGIITGLCILAAYPAMDLYSAFQHASTGRSIRKAVSAMPDEDYSAYERQAREYNEALAGKRTTIRLWPYKKQLAVEGEGKPFAELLIPKISLDMPIYHGTSEETLMNGVGHLKETSLPIGGRSTHSVLTAHSGMTGMRAFDDIRQMKKGDEFFIRVLGKNLAYRVVKTEVLWPEEADEKTGIVENEDRCTLITCTPYGVNDHRLLVYGKRTAFHKKEEKSSFWHMITNRRYLPFFLAALVLILLLLIRIIRKRLEEKHKRGGKKTQ